MMKLPALVFCALLAQAVQAQEPQQAEAAGKLLFHASRAWHSFSAAPPLSPAEVPKLAAQLSAAYRTALQSEAANPRLEWTECSFIQRLFENQENWQGLRRLDYDGDGRADIVYSGYSLCSEGFTTQVWHAGADGQYKLLPPGPALGHEYALLAWRPGPQLLMWKAGCCGDPVNQFRLLMQSKVAQDISVLGESQWPRHLQSKPRSFQARRELILRSTPKLENSYDAERSAFVGRASFGNQLRVYLPGAKGQVLTEQAGWQFVVMDEESNPLIKYDPYREVRAGWIQVR